MFLNLASCSQHCISIKHRMLATFNINKKKSILTAFKKKIYGGHADDKKNNPSTLYLLSCITCGRQI